MGVEPIVTWGRCWVLVTGASSGIGAALCVRLSKEIQSNSVIVGIARSKNGLHNTADNIKKSSVGITYIPYQMDLESAVEKDYFLMIKSVFDQISDKNFDRIIIVHNAGSLGKLNYMTDITDVAEINKYFSLNIGSMMSLNGCLLKSLRKLPGHCNIHIINMSSLATEHATKSWALYCAGKTARDMLMKVLAKEEKDLNILTYTPGAIETNMMATSRNNTPSPEVRSVLQKLYAEGTLHKMEDSLDNLIRVLKLGNYESGERINFDVQL